MTVPTQSIEEHGSDASDRSRFAVCGDLRLILPALGVLVGIFAGAALPAGAAPAAAVTAFLILAAVLSVAAARAGAVRSFGAANAVTALRLGAVALLIGALADPAAVLSGWWAAALAGLAWLLDGVDGAIARRRGEESRFGALFDQETDALLILAAALLLALSGKVGLWILAAGLLRYVLLGAGILWPALAAPLPKRKRRSVICAVMVAALVVCLVPLVEPAQASIIAAAALAALTLSFAIDLIWLLNNARDPA